MPRHPWSQPVITPPTPAWYLNGCWPASFVDQNFLSVSTTVPVACTVTVSPLLTVGPEPGLRISMVVATPGMDCMAAEQEKNARRGGTDRRVRMRVW